MWIKIGLVFQIIGFAFKARKDAVPFIVGWGGSIGLDLDPSEKNKILLWRDRNRRPYFKQPKRMWQDLELGCFVLGLIFQIIEVCIS